jgi:hypothetical protein
MIRVVEASNVEMCMDLWSSGASCVLKLVGFLLVGGHPATRDAGLHIASQLPVCMQTWRSNITDPNTISVGTVKTAGDPSWAEHTSANLQGVR